MNRKMKKFNILLLIVAFVFYFQPFTWSKVTNYNLQSFSNTDYPILINEKQNVLFEIFTATWCGWCHYSYDIFDTLAEKYGTRIINIRYHNQDSLSMKNITDRSSYYKVNGYPTMIFNGLNKMVGADPTSYPSVEKIVIEELSKKPKIAIQSTGYWEGNKLSMSIIIQSLSNETLNGTFMTVFTEKNVFYSKDQNYDYVSRFVFPSFQGINISIEPKMVYLLQYAQAVPDGMKMTDFEAVSFVQNYDTKEIYNADVFQMNSLIVLNVQPSSFNKDISRDTAIELLFQEGLVLNSINIAEMMIISKSGERINVDPEYDREKNKLTLYPRKLLDPENGYYFLIKAGANSLLSVNKRRLKTDIMIPFKTSGKPEIDVTISEKEINFGDLFSIENPEKIVMVKETNGNPVRFKIQSNVKWIECSESVFTSNNKPILIKANPLFMQTGENTGTVTITSILGDYILPVKGTLLNNEYPVIRFYNLPTFSTVDYLQVKGRTDGYRLYLGEKPIDMDKDGYFLVQLNLQSGWNCFFIKTMNMQRKTTRYPVIIYKPSI